ncbi:TetR/AcrR family transcriptional regulator [Hoeflea olei]|uniref:TetR family transcriptional regulator n=1 Tax=Hoeflea olei TaxID=1480615 RepID=A0A1C1Z163_9HYPH|nr:TetR/AcrR family transcriptional regulator [Hoeflea olei]OCW59488.1 TetR family transcriptional regulator [Hoeflea olei]
MNVSSQSTGPRPKPATGPRARTRKLMVTTASRLMQAGLTPSVSEVAEAAEVSRATAYRYFPNQTALVHAVVEEALGPILKWKGRTQDAEQRIADLFDKALPRIAEFEATFKAALRLSLEQWAQEGAAATQPRFTRGHRIDLLTDALAPLRGRLTDAAFDRLAQALSLIFGVELFTVLKDIWNLDDTQSAGVAKWAACALVRAAMAEADNRETAEART